MALTYIQHYLLFVTCSFGAYGYMYVFWLLPTHNRAVWPVFLRRDYWPCVDFLQMCIHKIRIRVYLKLSIKRNPIKVSFKFKCMFTNWNDKSKETVDTKFTI